MSRNIVVELFVPEGQLSVEDRRRTLQTLLASGFVFELEPGQGGFYVVDPMNWYDHRSPLSEAMDALEDASTWAIQLWRRLSSGECLDLVLSIERASYDGQDRFDNVGLSTSMPMLNPDPLFSQEFLAWARFLAELIRPWYGWGGSNLGLLDSETMPVSPTRLAALEPQPIEWLNIFGPPYVQRLSLHKLFSAPAWRIEFLAHGSVAVTLAPHPDTVHVEEAKSVARHLGVPGPRL